MIELNREQAIDILDRFDFFQGQRSGRELWNDKSFDVQEQDIAKFSHDVALLKNYIEELTAENEAWQKQLISQKEISDKAYYELACEVENLRADNARYEAENNAQFDKWLKLEEATKRHHEELFQEAKIAVKEDTVRKMQERLKEKLEHYPQRCGDCFKERVDQIAKELLEGEK